MSSSPRKRYSLTSDEAAAYLSMTRARLYDFVRLRQITHLKAGHLLRFAVEDLDEWVANRLRRDQERREARARAPISLPMRPPRSPASITDDDLELPTERHFT